MGEGLHGDSPNSFGSAPEAASVPHIPPDLTAKTRIGAWPSRFTEGDPFAGIAHTTRDIKITDPSGDVIFQLDQVEAPDFWSDTACKIAAQKYFVRTEVSVERSVFAMVYGVARTISLAGWDLGYFDDKDAAVRFRNDLAYLLIRQYGAFNSPVWFNVRRWHTWGIEGGPGSWAWDPEAQQADPVAHAYLRPQCSACFIHSVEDNLVDDDGIADFVKKEMRLFKYGSGSGANFSKLRETGGRLSPGGKASGLMSFLQVFDRAAGATKSGGTSRRAAKMVCVDLDHPEILDFIRWKAKEERKAKDLLAAGWSGGMEGEAYTTVGGQNANNSVRVTDAFMRALVTDGTFVTTSRVDGSVCATLKARDVWKEIATAAWACADPGVQYHDTINRWHTTPNAGPITASNPCSEYMSLDNSACNLASLRLTRFDLKQGVWDEDDAFARACEVFIVAQDILVDFSGYPTKAIAEGAHRFRQLGLGYADLGGALMLNGLPYDSAKGRDFAAWVTARMHYHAAKTSIALARCLGTFEGYARDSGGVRRVFEMHAQYATTHLAYPNDDVQTCVGAAWDGLLRDLARYGMRNAQLTLLAPTGTIGFLMDVATTGIEPLLGHVQYKSLIGGGTLKIVNPLIEGALQALGYERPEIARMQEYILEHGHIEGSPDLRDKADVAVLDCALPAGPSNRSILPEGHIFMMAAVQPFLSGAISKTINLDESATVEDIARYYVMGWTNGLKALAVYRNGCKGAQPVTTKKAAPAPSAREEVPRNFGTQVVSVGLPRGEAPADPAFKHTQRKLPKERTARTWGLKLDEHKIYLTVGEYEDGTPGEIFITLAKEGSTLGGICGGWAKAISLGLQYGVPLAELVETFTHTRFEPFGAVKNHATIKRATSILDLVMRVLAVRYLGRTDLQHVQPEVLEESTLPAPTHTGTQGAFPAPAGAPPARPSDAPLCPNCGALTVRTGSCHACPQCGTSLGCS